MPSYKYQFIFVDFDELERFDYESLHPVFYKRYYYSWPILKKVSRRFLNEIDYSIIMLYFKYNFSQELIGMIFMMSRQSVSLRIKRSISILRDHFEKYHKYFNR